MKDVVIGVQKDEVPKKGNESFVDEAAETFF